LIWQPERCLFAASSVIEGLYPSRKMATRLDRFQLGLRYVVPKEESRSIRGDTIAAYEYINVSNVIWFENDDRRWRTSIESLPHISLAFWRS